MVQTFTVKCPSCEEDFNLKAEVQELTDDKGTITDCPECGAEIEFDYTFETGLTVTPGQEFEDDIPEVADELAEDLEPDDDEEEGDL